jgi:hypothetical protein
MGFHNVYSPTVQIYSPTDLPLDTITAIQLDLLHGMIKIQQNRGLASLSSLLKKMGSLLSETHRIKLIFNTKNVLF